MHAGAADTESIISPPVLQARLHLVSMCWSINKLFAAVCLSMGLSCQGSHPGDQDASHSHHGSAAVDQLGLHVPAFGNAVTSQFRSVY
jgi:hypothetical protein